MVPWEVQENKMEILEWQDKLKKAVDGNMNHRVILVNKGNTSVFTHTGDGEESALRELNSFDVLADTVGQQPFTSRGACNVIDTLRNESLLDGYYRGNMEFPEHIAEVCKRDGTALEQGWIEVSMDQMDHKRAMATVTCTVDTNVETVLKTTPNQLIGWTAEVFTDLGRLEIEC
tara:strand:+ start:441 stop:962 length:522 start_codon:yes stop_codon:yes gene_type:complete